MKKLFLMLLILSPLCGCFYYEGGHFVSTLSVRFVPPTEWNGRLIPAKQICRAQGGHGATPALYVSHIPAGVNLLIMEINDLDDPFLNKNGGNGSIGFYHNGNSTATLLPVPGETFSLPSFAFEEKASRVNSAKPYPYMPPCIERDHRYSVTIKAVRRQGSFEKQVTDLLGKGEIMLGRY